MNVIPDKSYVDCMDEMELSKLHEISNPCPIARLLRGEKQYGQKSLLEVLLD